MATSSKNVYSSTLQSIIDAKLDELVRKRDAFEDSKTTLLKEASQQPSDRERLRVLLEGVTTCFGVRTSTNGRIISGSTKLPQLEQKLDSIGRFLAQPQYDPSISSTLLADWEASLVEQLDVQTGRYQYASLYARLVTEWLSAEKGISQAQADPDLEMSEGYEEVETQEKSESRATWAQSVFKPFQTDTEAIGNFLVKLFGGNADNRQSFKALKALRKKVADFEAELSRPGQFNPYVLGWVIRGLLNGDLLTEEKRNVLRDFLPNQIILGELADVLNLRMSRLDAWSWGEAIPLEQKRKIGGNYVIVMHEDLLQAIFLQWVGVKWSVFFKNALKEFIQYEGAWSSSRQQIPLAERKRREYYLGHASKHPSIQSKRNSLWLREYFMSHLMNHEQEDNGMDEGEEEADYGSTRIRGRTKQTARKSTGGQAPRMQMAAMSARQMPSQQLASRAARPPAPGSQGAKRHRKIAPQPESDADSDDDDEDEQRKNLMQLKQALLHLLASEILVNDRLHGGVTAFRAQFESWNPLLPHSTTLVILQFLGVSNRWLRFFQTFLQAPLGFLDSGAVEEPKLRQRGVPGSHPLSDVLGELVLFCLDFNVNQATKGGRLWRLHDDFYFWSTDHQKAITAWQTVTSFSNLMGLTLDEKKMGTVQVRSGQTKATQDPKLPSGEIRWGFLFLDAETGRFKIDQDMVDNHVDELKRQLKSKTNSVFSWIEAWNAYAATFFITNFGKPANCFGRSHIDMVLSTNEKVQRRLFDGDDDAANVVEYLKGALGHRFGMTDLPEGYIFFPSALGGLELTNPFIDLLQLRDAILEDPVSLLNDFEQAEKEEYRQAKIRFNKGQVSHYDLDYPDYAPEGKDKDNFFSFEEFIKFREEFEADYTNNLRQVFDKLLEQPKEEAITGSSDLMTALNLMDKSGVIGQPGQCGITGYWQNMTPYWKWVTQLYGPEIVKRFGGLNVVDNGVLPIGMVSLFRSKGIAWKE